MNEQPEVVEDIDDSEDQGFQRGVHFFTANRNIELSFVQSGEHVTAPGYQYGPLVRDHYLVHFVKSGKGKLYLHNTGYEVRAGHCFLIYPNQIAYYQADTEDPWEYYWLGLCGVKAESILQMIGFAYNHMIIPFADERILSTITELTDIGTLHEGDDATVYLEMGSLIRKVLFYLLEDNRAKNESQYSKPVEDSMKVMGGGTYADQYVNIVAKIIQNSYSQNIKVENIAEKLSINRSYLSATFKKSTGLAIKEFLTSYRIEQSCVMLRDQNKPVSEIASAVGYEDPLYFSRLFKKQVGCSPTEYRTRI